MLKKIKFKIHIFLLDMRRICYVSFIGFIFNLINMRNFMLKYVNKDVKEC